MGTVGIPVCSSDAGQDEATRRAPEKRISFGELRITNDRTPASLVAHVCYCYPKNSIIYFSELQFTKKFLRSYKTLFGTYIGKVQEEGDIVHDANGFLTGRRKTVPKTFKIFL